MPLESPRDLRFEGANAPEHRRPRAPDGSRDFALFVFPGPPIPHPSYNNFPAFRGIRPASRSASRRSPVLFFRAKTRGFVKVQGDPHSATFVNQNRETALQMSR